MPKFNETMHPPRILICGEAAAGKTGGLAQLANAGYRLMIHDFDANTRVIGSYLRDNAADVYVSTYAAAKITGTNRHADLKSPRRGGDVWVSHVPDYRPAERRCA